MIGVDNSEEMLETGAGEEGKVRKRYFISLSGYAGI